MENLIKEINRILKSVEGGNTHINFASNELLIELGTYIAKWLNNSYELYGVAYEISEELKKRMD